MSSLTENITLICCCSQNRCETCHQEGYPNTIDDAFEFICKAFVSISDTLGIVDFPRKMEGGSSREKQLKLLLKFYN